MSESNHSLLTALLTDSIRSKDQRQVGIEVERIALWPDGTALNYSGGADKNGRIRPGAGQLLQDLHQSFGWKLVKNAAGQPMGLSGDFGKVSLEPGSQVELAANPDKNLVKLRETIDYFEERVNSLTRNWGLRWICIGVNPLSPVEDVEIIPSPRYHIMTEYLREKDSLGTSMMRLTSSVQVNLDYTSEAEAIDMLQTSLMAAPISYALFANSPMSNKKNSGFLSYRQEIWRKTDGDRCGLLHEALAEDFSFDSYAKLAWERPLMFAQSSDGTYVKTQGKSLRQIAAGELPGVSLSPENLRNGIQQLFFESRLKPGYVEVRSIDGECPRERYAASAFWMGLLYSEESRSVIRKTLGNLKPQQREELFLATGREGLQANIHGIDVAAVALELADSAQETLISRGYGEEELLTPVFKMIQSKQNPAARRIRHFYETWDGSASALLEMAGQG